MNRYPNVLRILIIAIVSLSFTWPTLAQERERGQDYRDVRRWIERQAAKGGPPAVSDCVEDGTSRRDVVLNGNRITTQILNFGSISSPGNTITDIVWNGLGYGYEFGPFVAAEIVDENVPRDPKSVIKRDAAGAPVLDDDGNPVYVMHIVSDGLVSNGGEVSPDGTENWGWQPIPCAEPVGRFEGLQVVNPNSSLIPTSDAQDKDLDGKPDSWPDDWYNPNLREYVWPGALQQGASNADKEAMYFMNDYSNREFQYYPFPSDTTKRGLGLEVETRLYQWSNPLAEDAIFLVYKITNKSEKDLEKVVFGMWGDPHVGGPGDWPDDLAFFDRDLNMVFAFDADGRSDIPGRSPGYFGYKFLESPGRGTEIINGVTYPGDGIDNDGDGMVDESWTDGIDNDNDWNPETDDVGIDGIPLTGDEGEGDGIPTAGDQFDITKPGEPNFEFTDIDESDMIGLTSFASPGFAGNRISDDERVWRFVDPDQTEPFSEVPEEPGDYVFLYGSGSFPLRAGETKRFSIALLVGESLADLRLNAETVQQIFDVGYRFARPPDKPRVRAVPGDKKVTLYWDNRAEQSVDPLSRTQDFEGYVIYRSTDHEFSDQQTITDINGSKFLFKPLTTQVGVEARFDLDNGLSGPSPIPYPDRGVAYDLGNDTGLFHTFVDSNNVVNGQTYYYTVVAYDRGYDGGDLSSGFSDGIAPTETSKTITYNPVDDSYIFDVNTVAVIPRPVSAGYVAPNIESTGGLQRLSGKATGDIDIRIIDPMAVPDAGSYRLTFDEVNGRTVYSVTDEVPRSTAIRAVLGKTSSLGVENVLESSFMLRDASGNVLEAGVDYALNADIGSVEVLTGGSVSENDSLQATYRYQPVAESALTDFEESNPVFDGMHLFVQDKSLEIDIDETGWIEGGSGIPFTVRVATSGPGRIPRAADYEITFSDEPVTTGFSNNLPLPFRVVNLTDANTELQTFVPDVNANQQWDVGEQIIFLEMIDGTLTATWQVKFTDEGSSPEDGDIFYIATSKPFTPDDEFRFQTVGAMDDVATARENIENCDDPRGECIYVVPNPYVATNSIEPRNPVSRSERGDRRLYFANVPAKATIRIYTLAGELVDTINRDSSVDDGKQFWDMLSKDRMNIAYGLYIYHVEWDGGSYIGKFAVIK
ncbi:MAG: hypothetical protein HKN17_06320 [Rhodothermales bacterium]|nr:hypothetical protein [Rhodothermales bacterium]